jgi:hypothetical protein
MKSSDERLKPPASSIGDKAHSLAKVGLGLAPVVGGAAAELFQMILAPPLERRRQEWMEDVAEALRQLESEKGIDVDDLATNEAFVDTLMHASQVAMRTGQEEKRNALRNAVLNAASAGSQELEVALQQIFVNLVDEFTVLHVRVLSLLADPLDWFRRHNRQAREYVISGSLSQLIADAYPELGSQKAICNQIAKDLYNRGLLGIDNLHVMMSGQGVYERRATDLGSRFLRFISSPLSADDASSHRS